MKKLNYLYEKYGRQVLKRDFRASAQNKLCAYVTLTGFGNAKK